MLAAPLRTRGCGVGRAAPQPRVRLVRTVDTFGGSDPRSERSLELEGRPEGRPSRVGRPRREGRRRPRPPGASDADRLPRLLLLLGVGDQPRALLGFGLEAAELVFPALLLLLLEPLLVLPP